MNITLTDAQAAYLAGFIDGEGSLECQKQIQKYGRTPRYVLRLAFTLASSEPLETFCKWFPATVRRYPATDAKRSDRYRMGITKNVAVQLIERCLPFMLLKSRQAELILAIERVRAAHSPDRRSMKQSGSQPMPQAAVEEMESLFLELRSLKSNKRAMHCRINQAVA